LVLTEPRYEQADEMHGGVAAVSLHVANLGIATPFPRELSTKDLQLPGHPEIFVIGDTAAAVDATSKPLPGVASAAKQQASMWRASFGRGSREFRARRSFIIAITETSRQSAGRLRSRILASFD
jgi:hypothetical protein